MLESLKSKIVNIIQRINTKYSKHKANSTRNEGMHKHTHTEDLVSLTTLVTTNHNLTQLKAKVVKKLGQERLRTSRFSQAWRWGQVCYSEFCRMG